MEQMFSVSIEIDIDYEVGSPPDDTVDPYVARQPEGYEFHSVWMTRQGPTDGLITSDIAALYPPFTDADRRQVFCWVGYGTPTFTWDAESFPAGNLWLTTDDSWAVPLVVSAPAEGHWFACEGEAETDYRKWKQGKEETITL